VNITSALNAGALETQKGLALLCRNATLITTAKEDVAKPFAGLMQSQRQVEPPPALFAPSPKCLLRWT
jgi:hypothetical protein